MKHFYTVLAAALMASAVATAQPMPSKGMRFNYDKKQVAAKSLVIFLCYSLATKLLQARA